MKNEPKSLEAQPHQMKVDKEKFDALLQRMLKTAPHPEKDLCIKGKAEKVIPAIAPDPRKS